MACYLRIYCTDVRKAQSTDSCCRSSTVQHEQNTRHAKNKYLWKTRIETRLEPDERRPVSVVMHSADIARACSLREAVQIPTIIAAWSATSPLLPREQRAKLAAEHLHNKMPAWDLSPEAVLYVVATLQVERVPDMRKLADALVAPTRHAAYAAADISDAVQATARCWCTHERMRLPKRCSTTRRVQSATPCTATARSVRPCTRARCSTCEHGLRPA